MANFTKANFTATALKAVNVEAANASYDACLEALSYLSFQAEANSDEECKAAMKPFISRIIELNERVPSHYVRIAK